MKKIVTLIVLLSISLFVFLTWEAFEFLYYPQGAGKEIVLEVPQGASLATVAKQLQEKAVISDAWKFKVLGRLTNKSSRIRVGEYLIADKTRPMQVLSLLSSGRSIEYKFTIQEGLNRYEIAKNIEKAGIGSSEEFLALTEDRKFIFELLGQKLTSLEGYLYPETYKVTKYTSAKDLIRLMLKNFFKFYKEATAESKISGMSRHSIVTLASIVEKETGAAEERDKISAVFHNRLKKGMPLQTDPTILYGILNKTKVMKKNITRKDITTATPYNTYTFIGLPPGPISNPGKDAIKASVQPNSGTYLYFVSRNDGTSQFSNNLKDHNKAVRKYQLTRSNRVGKSWRNLKQVSKKNKIQNSKKK